MSVLVTGIGGNVAQGALRILQGESLRLVGTDLILPCGGSHLCDATYLTPHAKSAKYPDLVRAICSRENVELILPCTDIEAYVLAEVGLPVLSSPRQSQLEFLDKHLTALRCHDAGIPFAQSWLVSEYGFGLESVVVKERRGRGSRGVHFDPPEMDWQFDDDFVVQERLFGPELTIGFYADREGKPNGFITLERDLRQTGTTMLATVTREHDDAIGPLVRQVAETFGVRGSCNIQAIVTEPGRVIPFEINGRISGSASIRHEFGYPDVKWAVDEYLRGIPPDAPKIKAGTAVRLLLDVIYRDKTPEQIKSRRTPHAIF